MEWLQPDIPNDEIVSPVADVVSRISRRGGKAPEYEYVRVTAEEFARDAGETYPFKYYPEMTAKVRAMNKQRK